MTETQLVGATDAELIEHLEHHDDPAVRELVQRFAVLIEEPSGPYYCDCCQEQF